ncbi:MAG: hypothetical protein CK424_04675 [Legionella sp.]|nr:MAG: hypothetical protein CK424_04675 [Legionella sp.]
MSVDSTEKWSRPFDLSVSDDPHRQDSLIQALIEDPDAWVYLGEGTYNRVFRSKQEHSFFGKRAQFFVKKDSFPEDNIFLYRATELEQRWRFYYAQQRFECCISSQNLTVSLCADQSKNSNEILSESKDVSYLLVLCGDGLYVVDLSFSQNPRRISVKDSTLNMIIDTDLCNSKTIAGAYKLTTKTLIRLQTVCKLLHFQCNILPVSYNKKDRAARLLNAFYPNLPVYHADDWTLVMPFFAQNPSSEDIIDEMIRLFKEHHRIVADSVIRDNFKKDHQKTYLIDTDMATHTTTHKRRLSKGSEQIWTDIINEPCYEGQLLTKYQYFLSYYWNSDDDIYKALCALYYAHDQIQDESLYALITPQILPFISFFDNYQFPLEAVDLNIMGKYSEKLNNAFTKNPSSRELLYFNMILHFIHDNDPGGLQFFLDDLFDESLREDVLNTCHPSTSLTLAVMQSKTDIVALLLQYHADPLICSSQAPHDALDWAIRTRDCEKILTLLLNVLNCSNSHGIWTRSIVTNKKLIEEMQNIEAALNFHQHLMCIYNLFGRTYPCVIKWIDLLFAAERAFLLDNTSDVSTRNKLFIDTCAALITQQNFNEITNIKHRISIDKAIGKLDSALFSLKNQPYIVTSPNGSRPL